MFKKFEFDRYDSMWKIGIATQNIIMLSRGKKIHWWKECIWSASITLQQIEKYLAFNVLILAYLKNVFYHSTIENGTKCI